MAVVLPGTASSADFVTRAFGPPLASVGLALVTGDAPRGGLVGPTSLAALTDAVAEHAARVVGGISLGAHLAARWAAGRDLDGVLLVMPAWSGASGTLAAASMASADRASRLGIAAALETAAAGAPPWVAAELSLAWRSYDAAELSRTLHSAADEPGPTIDGLRWVTAPVGLVGLADDPLHPATVAHEWADALPRAVVVQISLAAVGADREALGRAAVLAWLRARTLSGSR